MSTKTKERSSDQIAQDELKRMSRIHKGMARSEVEKGFTLGMTRNWTILKAAVTNQKEKENAN